MVALVIRDGHALHTTAQRPHSLLNRAYMTPNLEIVWGIRLCTVQVVCTEQVDGYANYDWIHLSWKPLKDSGVVESQESVPSRRIGRRPRTWEECMCMFRRARFLPAAHVHASLEVSKKGLCYVGQIYLVSALEREYAVKSMKTLTTGYTFVINHSWDSA